MLVFALICLEPRWDGFTTTSLSCFSLLNLLGKCFQPSFLGAVRLFNIAQLEIHFRFSGSYPGLATCCFSHKYGLGQRFRTLPRPAEILAHYGFLHETPHTNIVSTFTTISKKTWGKLDLCSLGGSCLVIIFVSCLCT